MGLGTIFTFYDGEIVETNGNPPSATEHEAAVLAKMRATPPNMEVEANQIRTAWDSTDGPLSIKVVRRPNTQTLVEWERHWIAVWRAKSSGSPPT